MASNRLELQIRTNLLLQTADDFSQCPVECRHAIGRPWSTALLLIGQLAVGVFDQSDHPIFLQ